MVASRVTAQIIKVAFTTEVNPSSFRGAIVCPEHFREYLQLQSATCVLGIREKNMFNPLEVTWFKWLKGCCVERERKKNFAVYERPLLGAWLGVHSVRVGWRMWLDWIILLFAINQRDETNNIQSSIYSWKTQIASVTCATRFRVNTMLNKLDAVCFVGV